MSFNRFCWKYHLSPFLIHFPVFEKTLVSASIQTGEEWIEKIINERKAKFINPEELSIRDRLGSGDFGTVYYAEWDLGIKKTVAAAKFFKDKPRDKFINEVGRI